MAKHVHERLDLIEAELREIKALVDGGAELQDQDARRLDRLGLAMRMLRNYSICLSSSSLSSLARSNGISAVRVYQIREKGIPEVFKE
jgi:hypothetical protein